MRRPCLLGDAITLKRGYDLPHQMRQEGDIPIVSSAGITGTHAECKVRGPGVVTGRYGTLGEIHYVASDFWPLNTTLYVQDFKGNDPGLYPIYSRPWISDHGAERRQSPESIVTTFIACQSSCPTSKSSAASPPSCPPTTT